MVKDIQDTKRILFLFFKALHVDEWEVLSAKKSYNAIDCFTFILRFIKEWFDDKEGHFAIILKLIYKSIKIEDKLQNCVF